MRRLLPQPTDLAIFAVLALICAAIVNAAMVRDLGLSLLAIPLFVGCCFLGMHRSGQLAYIQRRTAEQAETNSV